MERNGDDRRYCPDRYFVQDDSDRSIHPASPPFPAPLWVNILVYKTSRRCLRLRENPLPTFETCLSIVPNYVGDARPDRHLKLWRPKDFADDGNVTAGFQA